MTEPEPTWGGRRPGSGRPLRKVKKCTPIWCGQMSPERRAYILRWLSPARREIALLVAAQKAEREQRAREEIIEAMGQMDIGTG